MTRTGDSRAFLDLIRWIRDERAVEQALAHFKIRPYTGKRWTNEDFYALDVLIDNAKNFPRLDDVTSTQDPA